MSKGILSVFNTFEHLPFRSGAKLLFNMKGHRAKCRIFFAFVYVIGLSTLASAKCITSLETTIEPTLTRPRPDRRINPQREYRPWNEPFSESDFEDAKRHVLLNIETANIRVRTVTLFDKLKAMAKSGRLDNLNAWIRNMLLNPWVPGKPPRTEAEIRHFLCEGEYALYALTINPHYSITFEPPETGFFKLPGGVRKKSIDLRIYDTANQRVVAWREIKALGPRGSLRESIGDAAEKASLFRRLQGPDEEIGVVIFYDYDPVFRSSDTDKVHPVSDLERTIPMALKHYQVVNGMPDNPIDNLTLIDFGTRQVLYFVRQPNNEYSLSRVDLLYDPFVVFKPRITVEDLTRP